MAIRSFEGYSNKNGCDWDRFLNKKAVTVFGVTAFLASFSDVAQFPIRYWHYMFQKTIIVNTYSCNIPDTPAGLQGNLQDQEAARHK